MERKLDENQIYDLLRRCVISFFAHNSEKLNAYGYEIEHFNVSMKFLKNLYYEHFKRKVDVQL